jgi:hypothetical protein
LRLTGKPVESSLAYAGRHMRKERDQPPEPALIDKLQLATSSARRVDGLWIGSFWEPEHLPRVENALLLVKQHSPLQYARIIRDLKRIWIYLLPHAAAEYHASINACVVDERYIANPDTSVEELASVIVHEATHARLDRCGIVYEETRRTRIEAVCCRRELAFAARLPDGARLREHIEQRLIWCQANPDHFSDTSFSELRSSGEIEMLRHVGMPEWLIRVHPTLKSWISRGAKTAPLLSCPEPSRGESQPPGFP